MKVLGYAATNPSTPLAPFTFERREPRPDDVVIDILYCGVCHSDLHQARNDWGFSTYPIVPGHEIVGRVRAVGSAVTKARAGAILRRGQRPDLQRAGPSRPFHNLRRIFAVDCRQSGFRAARAGKYGSAGRCATIVRRYHHLVAAASLEGRRQQ